MSVIDIIKSKIKELFWIRKTADLPGPPPVLCPRLTGDSQHPPPPRHLSSFLKPLCPNFIWIRHWHYKQLLKTEVHRALLHWG